MRKRRPPGRPRGQLPAVGLISRIIDLSQQKKKRGSPKKKRGGGGPVGGRRIRKPCNQLLCRGFAGTARMSQHRNRSDKEKGFCFLHKVRQRKRKGGRKVAILVRGGFFYRVSIFFCLPLLVYGSPPKKKKKKKKKEGEGGNRRVYELGNTALRYCLTLFYAADRRGGKKREREDEEEHHLSVRAASPGPSSPSLTSTNPGGERGKRKGEGDKRKGPRIFHSKKSCGKLQLYLLVLSLYIKVPRSWRNRKKGEGEKKRQELEALVRKADKQIVSCRQKGGG